MTASPVNGRRGKVHRSSGGVTIVVTSTMITLAENTGWRIRARFYGRGWYGVMPLAGFIQAVTSFDRVRVANGLY
jgi:hypothetical protein